VPGRPFPKGVSGNPDGRPRRVAEIESEIRQAHGDQVLAVIDSVRKRAIRGDMAAARLYLDRVLGPARAPAEPLPPSPPVPPEPGADSGLMVPVDFQAFEVTARILKLVTAQVAMLEAKAVAEGLTLEESAALAGHLRAVDGIGRWHEDTFDHARKRLDKMPTEERRVMNERLWCAQLGIAPEDLAALRAGRAA
jgi:hypothetical protein